MRAAELLINRTRTGVFIERDGVYPSMWRIVWGGARSDMVNLDRAKDAAVSWARPRGLGGNDAVRWAWNHRQSRANGPPMR